MPFLVSFVEQFAVAWAIIENTWWLWAPPALFYVAKEMWRYYLKVRYFASLEWTLLEVLIPQEVPKTPEAMEQIFAGLQTIYWGFDFQEKWWFGLQHDYIIFEMMSFGGEIHFYIRMPKWARNVVESHVYAQYPDAELREVEDYAPIFPDRVPNEEWDMFGIEFKLGKSDAYPLKTYRDYLSLAPGQKEIEKVDPFSSMGEVFGKIGSGEFMGYHLFIRPTQNNRWREEAEALVRKLIGMKPQSKKSGIGALLEPITTGWGEAMKPLFGLSAEEARPVKRDNDEEKSMMQHISPGTKDIVAAIERNILKPGFDTVIRFCYVARRDRFHLSHLSGFIGALKTYNTKTMNEIILNSGAFATMVPWWYPPFISRPRRRYKQNLFYRFFLARKYFTDTLYLRSKHIVLNTEELATIFHYPGTTTHAPLMPRLQSKRGEPPAALPVG